MNPTSKRSSDGTDGQQGQFNISNDNGNFMYSLPKKKQFQHRKIDVAPAEVNYRQKSKKATSIST